MEAARLALLNALAIAKQELGTLDRITRVVKVVGHVASAGRFCAAAPKSSTGPRTSWLRSLESLVVMRAWLWGLLS